MDQVVKSVPTGLCGQCGLSAAVGPTSIAVLLSVAIESANPTKTDQSSANPLQGGNNMSTLLDDNSSVKLLMGIRLTVPPSHISDDKLPTFNIADAKMVEAPDDPQFPSPK